VLLFFIFLGGALGSVSRFMVTGWVERAGGSRLPWGTLTVNASGSFLLGLLLPILVPHVTPELRAFVTVGFLGAFTTFSTFSLEAVELIRRGRLASALAYAALTTLLGLSAVAVGLLIGSRLT
jgi:fluoride exporter